MDFVLQIFLFGETYFFHLVSSSKISINLLKLRLKSISNFGQQKQEILNSHEFFISSIDLESSITELSPFANSSLLSGRINLSSSIESGG
ncbi:hypothetical protein BpHYR1_051831 [Brachionus plicatilis]|uniref:Uncharacterized protein n=1 Tax=Brachionus plicatilis TaxID=10195 RepID=A0A3M7RTG2_BRAPC|nr:hypothetical protein BpHYR1_051831 [Brachionus plicatilis]